MEAEVTGVEKVVKDPSSQGIKGNITMDVNGREANASYYQVIEKNEDIPRL